jgi:hypothetical protein
MMLRDHRPGARTGKHQRNVQQVEDHDSYEKRSRSAKEFPARDAEQDLHHEIEQRNALQIETEPRSPRQRKERDIGLVMNEVQNDVRQYREPNRRADVRTAHGFAEAPGERREKNSSEDRVGIRKEIQVDSIWSRADVLYSQIREQNPQKLDCLHRDEEGPEAHSWISFLENKRGRSMADRVRIASSCSWASGKRIANRVAMGNSRAAEVVLNEYSKLRRTR